MWVDRNGQEAPIPTPPRAYSSLRLSPDGTKVALDSRDDDQDIWIWDFARQLLTRLTFGPASDVAPVWTPDGERVTFSSVSEGKRRLFWQAADGRGVPERIGDEERTGTGPALLQPKDISPDGRSLLLMTNLGTGAGDSAVLDLEGDRRAKPLFLGNGGTATVSRDGRWVAYQSSESGRAEIFVHPFPEVDSGRWQISTRGGTRPVWSRDTHELFYLEEPGRMMAVDIQPGASFSRGRPQLLFDKPYALPTAGWAYDVSPDSKRFLMMKSVGETGSTASEPARLVVVQNFGEELKRLVLNR